MEPPRLVPMNRNRGMPPVRATPEPDINADNPILAGLNNAQSIAVTTPANIVQILAPPGSGKTRTLTSRVAHLLSAPQNLSPQNVIVATFTVKAAREMKERIAKLVGNGTEAKLVLGTFHSIARRYLLRYGHLIGLKNGWGIADTGDSMGIVKRILRRMKQPTTDTNQIRSRISHFKARNSSPVASDHAQQRSAIEATQTTQSTQQKEKSIANQDFVQIYEAYEAGLEASNLLDYDDLLLRCLDLLREHPKCVHNVEAVLIDEFQDTNLVQFELMRLLASKANRITIVGDPDQSIYGFRAAEIRNLGRMLRHYPDTLVVHLEQNYRSSASILLAALEVIQQDDSRPQKPLTPTHTVGTRPVLRKVPTAEREAAWIAGEISRIMAVTGGVIGLGDVAVLVRSASLTRLIEGAFVRAGLAYKMVGGSKFYDRVEIKTLLDYLRVVQNPSNNDAVARILNVPSRKIGDTTIKALMDETTKRGKTLWEVIRNGVSGHGWKDVKVAKITDKGLGDFVGVILATQRLLCEKSGAETEEGKTLVDVLEFLLRKLAFEEHLHRHYPEDWEGRWSNIIELLVQAREIGGADDDEDALPLIDGVEQSDSIPTGLQGALERFLSNTALSNEVVDNEEKKKQGQITISTIHAAKGLEWPVVFIPAVYEGCIPHSRSDDTDEERRLLYVAMTRAEALLYMSVPRRNSQKEKTTPSPFLMPSGLAKLLDKRAPVLRFSSVQSILQILGRDCPSEVDIQSVIEKSRITSLLDDQIPEMEEWEEKEGAGEEGGDEDDWRRRKRKRAEEAAAGGGNFTDQSARNAVGWRAGARPGSAAPGLITAEQRLAAKMTTAEKLAAAAVAGAAGFKSAGSHMEQLKQKSLTCEADKERNEKRARHDAMLARTAAKELEAAERRAALTAKLAPKNSVASKPTITIGAKSNKRAAGQGSLMSYFAPKPPVLKEATPKEKTATEVIKQTRGQSLKDQIEALPQPKWPVRPVNGGVILLSSSPVRPRTKKKRERTPSPPSSPVFTEFCKTIEDDGMAEAFEMELEMVSSVAGSFASASLGSREVAAQSGLSVNIETTTTVTEFSSASSLPRNAPTTQMQDTGVGMAKKRTLGIRRSMNGWQNRASAKKD